LEMVGRDQNLAFEMVKEGDLDYFYVQVPRQWGQELNFGKVQRGLIQKAKVYNDYPIGTRGIAFNTRKAPWSDVKVRQALAHLVNRKLFIEKIYFNEYVPLTSYFPCIYDNT